MTNPVHDASKLKKRIGDMSYRITQDKGTETPFTGKYWDEHADGTYTCVVCAHALFDAEHKFDSGTGWPSFVPSDSGKCQNDPR